MPTRLLHVAMAATASATATATATHAACVTRVCDTCTCPAALLRPERSGGSEDQGGGGQAGEAGDFDLEIGVEGAEAVPLQEHRSITG